MKPTVKILAGEVDVTATILDRLISFNANLTKKAEASTVTIEVDDNQGFVTFPTVGVKLSVAIGFDNVGVVSIGDFFVNDVRYRTPPDRISIKARSVNMLGSLKDKRSETYKGMTIGEIVETVAARHKLTAKVSEEFMTKEIDHIIQTKESDMNFLTRLAKMYNAIALPVGDYYVFSNAISSKAVSGLTLATHTFRRSDIISLECEFPGRNRYNSASASYWDKTEAKEVEVFYPKSAEEPTYQVRGRFKSGYYARTAAITAFEELQSNVSAVTLTIPGNPVISPKSKINLLGFKHGVNGTWLVETVNHRIGTGGFVTTIRAKHDTDDESTFSLPD